MASETEIKEAQLKSVRALKKQGVTGIKLELEASLRRGADTTDLETCTSCSGRGNIECEACRGSGWTIDSDGEESDEECAACNMEGNHRCTSCDGRGMMPKQLNGQLVPQWRSVNVCFSWLMNRIAEKTGTRLKNVNGEQQQAANPFPWMSFGRFYNDGSVDSELTCTIKLDKVNNVFYLPIVIEAFREMGEAIGRGINVNGAGMHTALIFDKNFVYPSSYFPLSSSQLANFAKANYQLLPALYFLSSSNGFSRGMNYRLPQIDTDGYDKYSAIACRQGSIEYRVFDTCYDNPEQILDNICVITNTMQYMKVPYKSPGILEETKVRSLTFGHDEGRAVSRLYSTLEHYDVLEAGLKRLKPEYKSITELKKERKFTLTRRAFENKQQEMSEQAHKEYEEYCERFDAQKKQREHRYRAEAIEGVVRNMPLTELRKMSQADLKKMVADTVKANLGLFDGTKQPSDTYVENRVKSLQSATNKGRHTLSFYS